MGATVNGLADSFRHVTIYQAPAGKSAMYASLVDLGGSEILCAFRTSTLDGSDPWTNLDDEIVCLKSYDGGETWDPATLRPVYADPTRHDYIEWNAPLLRDGRVMLGFYEVLAEHDEEDPDTWQAPALLTCSSDRGDTWSEPKRLDSPLGAAVPYGGVIRLQDGDLLLCHYGIGHRDRPEVAPGLSAPAVMRSSDEGQTWREFTYVAYERELEQAAKSVRGINETDIAQLGDGRLVAMSRTYKDSYPLYRSLSTDNGYTWRFGPTKLHGLCPALLWVPQGPAGGTTILAYHDRYLEHQNRGGVYLTFSYDAGETWGEQVFVSAGAYPCLLPLESGEILLAYYTSSVELQGTFFRA